MPAMQRPSTAPVKRSVAEVPQPPPSSRLTSATGTTRRRGGGGHGYSSHPDVSLGAKWPAHLVPLCVDERTTRAFPFVVDVAHLANFAELRYYARPVLREVDADTASAAESGSGAGDLAYMLSKQRGATSRAVRYEYFFRPHEVLGTIHLGGAEFGSADDMMIDDARDDDGEDDDENASEPTPTARRRSTAAASTRGLLSDDDDDGDDSSENDQGPKSAGASRRSSGGGNTQLSRILAKSKRRQSASAAAGLDPLDASVKSTRSSGGGGRDDGGGGGGSSALRMFRLRVPNHVYYVKPASLDQQVMVEKHLPSWIEACRLDVYNSPLAILHVVLTLNTSPPASPNKKPQPGNHRQRGQKVPAAEAKAREDKEREERDAREQRELNSVTNYRFVISDTSTVAKEQFEATRGAVSQDNGDGEGGGKSGVSTAFGALRVHSRTAEAGPNTTLSGIEPCVIYHDVSSAHLEGRRHVLVVVPFSVVSTVTIAPSVDHARQGRLSLPGAQRHVSLGRVFGLHGTSDTALSVPLVSLSGSTSFVGDLKLWWEPVAYEGVSLSVAAHNILRKGFYFTDPMLRLSLKVDDAEADAVGAAGAAENSQQRQNGGAGGGGSPTKAMAASPRAGGVLAESHGRSALRLERVTQADADPQAGRFYNVFRPSHLERIALTEAYRNRSDAAFRPMLLGCPMQLHLHELVSNAQKKAGDDDPHISALAASLPSVCNAAAAVRRHAEALLTNGLKEAGLLDHHGGARGRSRSGPSPLAPFTASWGGVRVTSAKNGSTSPRGGGRPQSAGGASAVVAPAPHDAVIAAGDTGSVVMAPGFPAHILPPVPLADRHRAAVSFSQRYGNIASSVNTPGMPSGRQLPVVDWHNDVLHFDMVDGGVDPDSNTTCPVVAGSFEVAAKNLLRAGAAAGGHRKPRRFPITRSTTFDDLHQSRPALRGLCPSIDSFVGLTPNARSVGTSQLLSRDHQRRATKEGMWAQVIDVDVSRRATFQDYIHPSSGTWELAGGLFLDMGSESYMAHRQQCFANGWNGVHGVIAASSTFLAPHLRRGALDLYSCAVEIPHNQFVVNCISGAPDAFGVPVDEIALHREMSGAGPAAPNGGKSARGSVTMGASSRNTHSHESSTAASPAAKKGVDGPPPAFPPISARDWTGESLIPLYDSRRTGVSKSVNTTLPFFLCATLRRAALRAAALQETRRRSQALAERRQQRRAKRMAGTSKSQSRSTVGGGARRAHFSPTVDGTDIGTDTEDDDDGSEEAQKRAETRLRRDKELSGLPSQVFYTAIAVVGPGGAPDFDEALRLLGDLSSRNIFVVIVFMDSYADKPGNADDAADADDFRAEVRRQRQILQTFPNVRSAVVPAGTGRFADIHQGVESVLRSLGDLPEAFLCYARFTGTRPSYAEAPELVEEMPQQQPQQQRLVAASPDRASSAASSSRAGSVSPSRGGAKRPADGTSAEMEPPQSKRPVRPSTAPTARRPTTTSSFAPPVQRPKKAVVDVASRPGSARSSRPTSATTTKGRDATALVDADIAAFRSAKAVFLEAFGLKDENAPPVVATPKATAEQAAAENDAAADRQPAMAAPDPDIADDFATAVVIDYRTPADSNLRKEDVLSPLVVATSGAAFGTTDSMSASPTPSPRRPVSRRSEPSTQIVTAAGEAVMVTERAEYAAKPRLPTSAAHRRPDAGVSAVTLTVVDLFQSEEEATRRQQAQRRAFLQQRAAANAGRSSSAAVDNNGVPENTQQRLSRLHHERFAHTQRKHHVEDDVAADGSGGVSGHASENGHVEGTDRIGAETSIAPDDANDAAEAEEEAAGVAAQKAADRLQHGRGADAAMACGILGTTVTRSGKTALDRKKAPGGGKRRPHTAGAAGRGGTNAAAGNSSLVHAIVNSTPQDQGAAERRAIHEKALRSEYPNGEAPPQLVVPMPPPPTLPPEDRAMASYVRDSYGARAVRTYAGPKPRDLLRRLQQRGPLHLPNRAAERGHDDPRHEMIRRAQELAELEDERRRLENDEGAGEGSSYRGGNNGKRADYYAHMKPEAARMLRWIDDPKQQQARAGPEFVPVNITTGAPTKQGRQQVAAQAASAAKAKAAQRAAAFKARQQRDTESAASSPRQSPRGQRK